MLGTIITEWGPGKQLLEKILASEDNIEKFTAVTAAICAHYGFHGWLLNIENEVEPELVGQLIKLTKKLTEAVKKKIGSEGVVLWYDSVTIKVGPSLRLLFVHQSRIVLNSSISKLVWVQKSFIKDTEELERSFTIKPFALCSLLSRSATLHSITSELAFSFIDSVKW